MSALVFVFLKPRCMQLPWLSGRGVMIIMQSVIHQTSHRGEVGLGSPLQGQFLIQTCLKHCDMVYQLINDAVTDPRIF